MWTAEHCRTFSSVRGSAPCSPYEGVQVKDTGFTMSVVLFTVFHCAVCDDLARGSDCWLYLKPPWPARQQLGTHRRSTAETHERTWRLIWLLQWLALHQTGSNCEVDVRRQTEAGGKAQAAWQQARLEGGSPEHADLLLPLIIGHLFLCLPVGVFKKKPQCHCASCQESTYLGFNGAHVGTFFLSAQQFYWENQLTKANGNTFLGFFPLWWL